jgi:Protein of unknown function (DUF2892)
MKKNVGSRDQTIRMLVALILVVLQVGGILTGTLGIAGLVIAGVFALTSFVGICPLYSLLGISTCPIKSKG